MARIKASTILTLAVPVDARLSAALASHNKNAITPTSLGFTSVMTRFVHYFKIINSVVSPVSIDVVHNLRAFKLSSHRPFHNISMLVNIITINANAYISILHDASASAPAVVICPGFLAAAASGAEFGNGFSVWVNKKLFAAHLAK